MKAPNVIHIEPSAAGSAAFPMEVGLVLHNGAAYCLVTRPAQEGFTVDPALERATGLSQAIRERRGRPAAEVAQELNHALLDGVVYFDERTGADVLLRQVFAAAGSEPSFGIATLQSLMSADDRAAWDEAVSNALDEQRHIRGRASDKALVLQQTFLRGPRGR